MRLITIGLISTGLLLAQADRTSGTFLGPLFASGGQAVGNATNIFIQSASQRIAYKFYAKTTSAVDSVDLTFNTVGTITGVTLKAHIETDSSDAPSGTTAGAETSAFSAPANNAWTGLQNLGTNTGTLTINTPYWLVVTDGGGTAPTSSNYVQAKYATQLNGGRIRQYNGTNWTTTAAFSGDGIFVVHHANGTYTGIPFIASAGNGTQIKGTTIEGVKFKVGVGATLRSVWAKFSVAGSPANLRIDLMQSGSTSVISYIDVPYTSIVSSAPMTLQFSSAQALTANTAYYLIFHQSGGGGDSSNYYTIQSATTNSTYAALVSMGAPYSRVFNSTTSSPYDPDSLTVDNTKLPQIVPIIGDALNDLAGSTSGGTRIY